jgi:hypothetical protein
MRIRLTWLLLGLILGSYVWGQSKPGMTREMYINTFADLAMKEMVRVGIPASITLAQGCLESDNGNSRLAVKGNNHFGIKCHEWNGKAIYHNDDKRNECFRSYTSAYESYMDHSHFLTTKERYAQLFELRMHDYRGWARGLKKAGYATAPNYANMLINIIEDNELYRFDLLVLEGGMGNGTDTISHLTDHGYTTTRDILVNNRIEYVVVQPGDNPESLRAELDLYRNEIYRYNNLYRGERLEPGQIIYLQPKRRKASRGNEVHIVENGQTMYDISQLYGVKLKFLYRKNLMTMGEQPLEGTEIYLRRKKRDPLIRLEPEEEQVDEEVMRFSFDDGV